MAFADPPFNLRKKYKAHKDQMEMDDYLRWCEAWMREMIRVVKPGGAVFVHNIPKWLTFYAAILNREAVFKHWIAWDAPTSPMGKSLLPSHYGVLYYIKDGERAKFRDVRYPHPRCRNCGRLLKDYGGKKDALHPFGPLVSDVWSDLHRIRHSRHRDDHPCQLPLALLERLTLMSTDEGDLILDPFLGTGTTAVAAARLGRRHIGFELSPEYAAIARRKVENEAAASSRLGTLGFLFISVELSRFATPMERYRAVFRRPRAAARNRPRADSVAGTSAKCAKRREPSLLAVGGK